MRNLRRNHKLRQEIRQLSQKLDTLRAQNADPDVIRTWQGVMDYLLQMVRGRTLQNYREREKRYPSRELWERMIKITENDEGFFVF